MPEAEHVSARDARARFAELTDRVKYTGEPIVIEKQGRPFVAIIRAEDLPLVEHLRVAEREAGFRPQALDEVVPLRADEHPVLAEIWGGDDDDDIFAAQPAI